MRVHNTLRRPHAAGVPSLLHTRPYTRNSSIRRQLEDGARRPRSASSIAPNAWTVPLCVTTEGSSEIFGARVGLTQLDEHSHDVHTDAHSPRACYRLRVYTPRTVKVFNDVFFIDALVIFATVSLPFDNKLDDCRTISLTRCTNDSRIALTTQETRL